MVYSLPLMMKTLHQHDSDALFQNSFFGLRRSENLGVTFLTVKPVLQFPGGEVELGYKVGTRGNGVDHPVWPRDLGAEVVTIEH